MLEIDRNFKMKNSQFLYITFDFCHRREPQAPDIVWIIFHFTYTEVQQGSNDKKSAIMDTQMSRWEIQVAQKPKIFSLP